MRVEVHSGIGCPSGCTYLEFLALWPFLRGVVVVSLQVQVAYDVIIHQGVSLGAEVPGLLLGVVGSALETSELVLEVDDVEGLLVAQSPVLVLGQDVDEVVVLVLPRIRFDSIVRVDLSYRIVLRLLGLDGLVGDLLVLRGVALEVGFS